MVADLRLLGTRVSQVDDVTKYLFDMEGQRVEYVGLTNHGGKDVVCVPSQSGCRMSCLFCHLTARGEQKVKAVDPVLSAAAIRLILEDRGRPEKNPTLLVSFMGMGEPLLDPDSVGWLAGYVGVDHSPRYERVRFGLSTIIPKASLMRQMQEEALERSLDLKVHWSLHHPFDEARQRLMPRADNVHDSLKALVAYRDATGNPIEIHYTLFEGNDDEMACRGLIAIAAYHETPVKFLRFSERPDRLVASADVARRADFVKRVQDAGVAVEEYTPPGADVLGACGEFEP